MITVDDADVLSLAAVLNCTFEKPHVDFLKAISSCNLHACPGSGKTTLLVAKLAILARKWPWRDRGILVLSHTNVARREVEQRLQKEPSAARLLSYPHFIGTIQGFVDRFLALPFLRWRGEEAPRIDDDLFALRATSLFYSGLGWKAFGTARGYLSRRHQEGRPIVASLHYSGAQLDVAAEEGDLPGPNTATTKQLLDLKRRVSAEGIFRYADMFAFAAASLKAHPFLRGALRGRFPWVFVDEMQDTSNEQETLLNDIFSGAGIVFNKIGDKNQAIFSEAVDQGAQHELAWANSIDLPQSKRLAPKLAELVSPLAVVHPLRLQGNSKRKDRAHTIFLFDDATISDVLPAFGTLILKEWGGSLPKNFVAKAVGFRRRPHEKPSIPGSLVDYWSEFEARPIEARQPHASLLSAVLHARRLAFANGEFLGAHRLVFNSLARLMELHEGARVTPQALRDRCKSPNLDERLLTGAIAALLRTDCVSSAGVWAMTVKEACAFLAPGMRTPEVDRYVAWEDESTASKTMTRATHVFVHRKDHMTVAIEVATIHAVKGETHDATLVLETLFHEHDVQLAVPVLLGKRAPLTKARLVGHMKRLFVASTRPKELLCVALHRTHATEKQLGALRDLGWSIDLIAKAATA